MLGEKGQLDDADKVLRGLLKGGDDDEDVYLDLAQVQERGRRYAEAEQSALKAQELANESAEKETATFMLGAIYERQKKYDLAETQFKKALELDPKNAAALNYYGYMLADRGVRLEEATSLIRKALEQEPGNGAYLDSLGWAYYKQNKLAEAEEALTKAVSAPPTTRQFSDILATSMRRWAGCSGPKRFGKRRSRNGKRLCRPIMKPTRSASSTRD